MRNPNPRMQFKHKFIVPLSIVLAFAGAAQAAFTPIPLNPSSFNKDPVIEASAPNSLNDYVTVTPDAGTNKTGNTWYEMGYNTNIYTSPTYSGPLTGLPAAGSTFTAISNANRTFQMPPTYTGNCVIFVGHNNSTWTPILGPGTFTLTTPAAYSTLTVLSGTGNGANIIGYTVNHLDGTFETGSFSSPDWFSGPSANTAWRAGGLVNMNGGINNINGNAGTMWMSDIVLGNTTSPVTNVVFQWLTGSSNGHSPWGNGRTFIFGISGSTDGTTFTPIAVTGYDHDGVIESTAPASFGAGSPGYTGVLTNSGTYCNFTMDGGIYQNNWTWYESGYYAAYPGSGLPAAGSTITSATEPSIQYTMPSTYAGNCAVCLSSNILSDTITFASPTAAGSLAFLCGGGNGGFNLRVEISYQGGGSETNWITVPDWFNRTAPWSYVTFGQVRPEARCVRNTPDQLQNNWIPVQPFGNLPPGQPFSRDPRNGGASFPDLPIVRLYDAVIPVANSSTPISSINVVVKDTTTRQATAGAVLSGSSVTSYTITDGGAGYVSVPAVTITGDGSNATATAVLNVKGQVVSLTPGNAGSGYSSPPTVTIAAPLGSFGNSVAIFAVSGSPGAPPVLSSTTPNQPNGQPVGLVTDSATGSTNATTAAANADNIRITKGWQGTNNISLIVSNSFPAGAAYQWKRAPRGGGWRDRFLTDYDLSTFANVSGPNIGGSTSNWLTISNATLADSADYLVVVANSYGSTTSFVATVMVLSTNAIILSGASAGDVITHYTGDGTSGNGQETFTSAIDQTQQKWLSTGLGSVGLDTVSVPQATIPFVGPGGFVVQPVNGTSIVSSIVFYCANDTQGRDPRDYLLEGSGDGSTWSTISGGSLLGTLMMPVGRDSGGTANGLNPFTQPSLEVDFANATAYKYYRFTVTNCMEPVATPLMQVAEIQLLGTLVPNPPFWVRQPLANVTVFVGGSPTWGVQAGGSPPPKWQWYRISGGPAVPIPNATNATYTLSNAQLSDSSSQFYVTAQNIAGTITSSSSTLTVIAAPTQTYPAAVLANSPRAYWRLDEGPDNASGNDGVSVVDYTGGHNGTYSNALIAVSGYNPTSDPDTAAQFGSYGAMDNYVDNIFDLDFSRAANTSGATFSVEAWVFPNFQSANAGLVSKGYNGALAAGTGTGTEQFVLDTTGAAPGLFRFLVRDASGNGNVAQSSMSPFFGGAGGTPVWHHLVGVCDQPNGHVYLYVDGLLAGSGTIGSTAGILKQTLPITIGARKSTQAADYDNQWSGKIDDVAIYGTALSASQVLAHYYAAQDPPKFSLQPVNVHTNDNTTAVFTSVAYGPGTVTYQWYNSDGTAPTTPIGGQTAANYAFTATPGANGNFYQVVAANAYGMTTSLVAQLTVESGAPGFVFGDLPASQTVFIGHFIQLHVVPSGTAPFTYQWQRNSINLSDDYRTAGSLTDTLIIGYATNTDSTTYNCVVTGAGSTSSTVDALTVSTNNSAFFGAGNTAAEWQLNYGNPPSFAPILGVGGTNAIQLTDNGTGSIGNSAFLKATRNIASFAATFIYQDVSGVNGADGVTFCIQNDPRGATAVGGTGGSLAVNGITPSAELDINIYAPNTRGIEFSINGAGGLAPFMSLLPNVLIGDDTSQTKVDLNYNGTVLTATFTDLQKAAPNTFTTNITVNLPSILGASTAYVGFTGADGGVFSTQIVSWPSPTATRFAINRQIVSGNLILTWPASAGAFLQTAPAVGSPLLWGNDNVDTFRVVGTNATVTVALPTAGSEYFRLQIFP